MFWGSGKLFAYGLLVLKHLPSPNAAMLNTFSHTRNKKNIGDSLGEGNINLSVGRNLYHLRLWTCFTVYTFHNSKIWIDDDDDDLDSQLGQIRGSIIHGLTSLVKAAETNNGSRVLILLSREEWGSEGTVPISCSIPHFFTGFRTPMAYVWSDKGTPSHVPCPISSSTSGSRVLLFHKTHGGRNPLNSGYPFVVILWKAITIIFLGQKAKWIKRTHAGKWQIQQKLA